MIKKRNPIIIRYVSKIRKKLGNKRWYYKKRGYYYKNKKLKKIRNPIIMKYVKKIRYRLMRRRGRIKNKKKNSIDCWVRRGLITNNIDEVYKRYEETTNCDNCNIFLDGIGGARKCMDHSHITGEFRNIICVSCNSKRGENNL